MAGEARFPNFDPRYLSSSLLKRQVVKYSVNVTTSHQNLKATRNARINTPIPATDEEVLDTYGPENGKLLIGSRNVFTVLTTELSVFPELTGITITSNLASSCHYGKSAAGHQVYITSGMVIRLFNFVSYSLSCRDVLTDFHLSKRTLIRNFDVVSDELEDIMTQDLVKTTGLTDDHSLIATTVTLSGLLSIICHEVVHIAKSHAAMRRPFAKSIDDDTVSALSKNGLTEFNNIRLKDFELASFFRGIEFDADFNSWPNGLERTKILCQLFENMFGLDADPHEIFLVGLFSTHTFASHYKSFNLDVDTDIANTFDLHPSAKHRLFFLKRMMGILLNSGAFSKVDALYLSEALKTIGETLGALRPYPSPTHNVLNMSDDDIFAKDYDNFRKIATQ